MTSSSKTNAALQEEKAYLIQIKGKLRSALKRIDLFVKKQHDDLQEAKKYLYEHKSGMDHAEKVAVRQSVTQGAVIGEGAVKKKARFLKLMDSPYFGRIDFQENSQRTTKPIYIGVHSFFDDATNTNLIHDWRAPVSNMYYDFELGEAFYEAPTGKVSGTISLKRQYRIRRGKMEYMLENASTIYDEVLQRELSKASDAKMSHIVATIQKDQHPIIRNESSRVLIIQGVAGSGKTSIALHRIAFLLYRYKDKIKAENILIISPNKVYADYIANVLPELGEEMIPEKGMEELAKDILGPKVQFQTFYDQVSSMLEVKDHAFKDRIHFKSSNELISKLDQFLVFVEKSHFTARDIWVGKSLVPAWFVEEQFHTLHRLPIIKRFPAITRAIEDNIRFYYKREISTAERNFILKEVSRMFKTSNLRLLYKEFFSWLGNPSYLKMAKRSIYEYADVFPLIYMKLKLEGSRSFDHVKHLLVDEMQDYTPVQYAVISRLFPCDKTILGDNNQLVSLQSAKSSDAIKQVFPDADIVKLLRSYRSTYEITRFSQSILPDADLIAMERHGEKPVICKFDHEKKQIKYILEYINAFNHVAHHSLGIICKTLKQAEGLYEELKHSVNDLKIITNESRAFSGGIILTTIHLSKGLEFDQVLIPDASAKHFENRLDQHLLYIASTRAMHKLCICYTGEPSRFISPFA